ncbi:hypothetical protein ON010_g2644 [Phytophthora cinnamomi]|nr:hypothetical protein ON010_g2644 [Phytophthora cinnamomi]
MPSLPKPFQKRQRLTKQQELQICDLRRQLPAITNVELAVVAKTKLSLPKQPSPHVIARVLKSETMLRSLPVDCLARKKIRPRFQCELDHCVVEYVLMCEDIQVSLTGEMIIMRARKIARLLEIPPSSLPSFTWSWLHHVQSRYGIRWKRAHGESGAVDLEAAAPEVERLRGIIATYSHS